MISGSSHQINDYYGYYSTISPSGKRIRRMRRTELSNQKKSHNSSKNLSSQKNSSINNQKSKLSNNKNSNILSNTQSQTKNSLPSKSQNTNLFSINNFKQNSNDPSYTSRKNKLQINTGVVGIKMTSLSPSLHISQPSKLVLVNQSTSKKKGSKIKKQKSILYVEYNNFMTDQATGNNGRNSAQSNKMTSSKDLRESGNVNRQKQAKNVDNQNQYCFGPKKQGLLNNNNNKNSQQRKSVKQTVIIQQRKNLHYQTPTSTKNDKSIADLSITSSKEKRHSKPVQASPKTIYRTEVQSNIKTQKTKISKQDLASIKQKNYNTISNHIYIEPVNKLYNNNTTLKQDNIQTTIINNNLSPRIIVNHNEYFKKQQINNIITLTSNSQKNIKHQIVQDQNHIVNNNNKTEKFIKISQSSNINNLKQSKQLQRASVKNFINNNNKFDNNSSISNNSNIPQIIQNPYHLNKNSQLVNKFNSNKKKTQNYQLTKKNISTTFKQIIIPQTQQFNEAKSQVSDSAISISSSKRGRRLVKQSSKVKQNSKLLISKSKLKSSIIIQPKTPQPYVIKYNHQSQQLQRQQQKQSNQQQQFIQQTPNKNNQNQQFISVTQTKNKNPLKVHDYNPNYYTPNPYKSKHNEVKQADNNFNLNSNYQSDNNSSMISDLQSVGQGDSECQNEQYEGKSEYQSSYAQDIQQDSQVENDNNFDSRSNTSKKSLNPRRSSSKLNQRRSVLRSSRLSQKSNLSVGKKIDIKKEIKYVEQMKNKSNLKQSIIKNQENKIQQTQNYARSQAHNLTKSQKLIVKPSEQIIKQNDYNLKSSNIISKPIQLIKVYKKSEQQQSKLNDLKNKNSSKKSQIIQPQNSSINEPKIIQTNKNNKPQSPITINNSTTLPLNPPLKNSTINLPQPVKQPIQTTKQKISQQQTSKKSSIINNNKDQLSSSSNKINSKNSSHESQVQIYNNNNNNLQSKYIVSTKKQILKSQFKNKNNQSYNNNSNIQQNNNYPTTSSKYEQQNSSSSIVNSLPNQTIKSSFHYQNNNKNQMKNSLYNNNHKKQDIFQIQSQEEHEEFQEQQQKEQSNIHSKVKSNFKKSVVIQQSVIKSKEVIQNKKKIKNVEILVEMKNNIQQTKVNDQLQQSKHSRRSINNLYSSKHSLNNSQLSIQASKHLKSILTIKSGRNLQPFSLQNPTIQQFINYLDQYQISIGFLYLYTQNTLSFYNLEQQDAEQQTKPNPNTMKYKNNIKNKKNKKYEEKYEKLSFLVLKKYLYEKNRIIKCLKGLESNIFNITGLQIPDKIFKRFINHKETKQKLKDIQLQTKEIFKSLEEKYRSLRLKNQNKKDKLIKLQAPNDNFTKDIVNLLLQQLNQLTAQIDQLQQQATQSQISSHTGVSLTKKSNKTKAKTINSIIAQQIMTSQQRSIQIMELIFLLSELQGRKIKKLQLINISDIDFQSYYENNIDRLLETYEFFESLNYGEDEKDKGEKKKR